MKSDEEKISLFDMALENAEDFLEYGDLADEILVYKHIRAILRHGLDEGRLVIGEKYPENCIKIINRLFDDCYALVIKNEKVIEKKEKVFTIIKGGKPK